MENLDATRKTEGKKRQAKFMCSFTFAAVSIFLMFLTHLLYRGAFSEKISNLKVKEKTALQQQFVTLSKQ